MIFSLQLCQPWRNQSILAFLLRAEKMRIVWSEMGQLDVRAYLLTWAILTPEDADQSASSIRIARVI